MILIESSFIDTTVSIVDETPQNIIIIESNFIGGSGGGGTWGTITGTLSNQTDLQSALDAKVPYTGATGNVTLGEYGLTTGYSQFDTTPTQAGGVGRLIWNDTDGTLDLGLKGGNVTLQVGQEQVVRVVNKTGSSLAESAYQIVRVSSAQGQRLGVALAQANNDANSADTLGMVTETIANNQEGFITISGLVNGINTTGSLQGETWADGDILYLSGTIAGAVTNVKPSAPTHLVRVGYVVYAHANNGKIFVSIMNGYELSEIHDVNITSPTNGQILKYDSATNLWKNSSDSATWGVIGGTLSNQTDLQNALNAKEPSIATGTSLQYWRGDKSWQTLNTAAVPESTNLYYTDARSRAAISETITGIDYNNTTGVFSITSGYGIPTTASQSNWDSAYSFTSGFPSQTGNSGKYLTTNGSVLSWGTISTANIYNSDGTLTGNRTVTQSGNSLTFTGGQINFGGSVTGTGFSTSFSVTASGGIARSKSMTPTLIAAANNDVLVGLDVAPTFTNGAFTGLTNYALRSTGTSYFTSTVANNTTVNVFSNDASGTGSSYGVYSLVQRNGSATGYGVYGQSVGGSVNYGGYFYGNGNGTANRTHYGIYAVTGNYSGPTTSYGGYFYVSGGTTGNHYGVLANINIAGGTSRIFEGRLADATKFYVNYDGAGYFAGSVGIGLTNPSEELTVKGTIRTEGLTASDNVFFQGVNSAGTLIAQIQEGSTIGYGGLQFSGQRNDNTGGIGVYFASYVGTTASGNLGGIEFRAIGGTIASPADLPSGIPIFNISKRASGATSYQMRMFQNGNVLLQDGGTYTDAGYKLDVNGTTRFTGSSLISGSTTASSAIARGAYITSTLVAAANNDNLYGLEIAPTFTNGAFTGVKNYSLRVLGDVQFNGSDSTSSNYALYVNNSSSQNILRIRNDGVLLLGVGNQTQIYPSNSGTASISGAGITFRSGELSNANYQFWYNNTYTNLTYTSGTGGGINIRPGFAPTSGTGVYNVFSIDSVINQTGGASGITRGVYVQPTLTAAADWRSIETSNNSGYAAYFAGTAPVFFANGANIQLATTTGTKIGTATSQKLSFWNATPIVQPTTAVAGATRVGGAGTTVTDTDTFDGYTIAQVVKALRNAGLLA